jgi:hypothetical protein
MRVVVRVRLTRRLAESIDGIDLAGRRVGDIFEVTAEQARILEAEQWAVVCDRTVDGPAMPQESTSRRDLLKRAVAEALPED